MKVWENETGTCSCCLEGATVEWLPRISLVSSIRPGRGRGGTQVAPGLEDVDSHRKTRQFSTAPFHSVRKYRLADRTLREGERTGKSVGRDRDFSYRTTGCAYATPPNSTLNNVSVPYA